MTKPLAKSLHTITVLVRVTKAIADYEGLAYSDAKAMALALSVLGLDAMPDAYRLTDAATKQLIKL